MCYSLDLCCCFVPFLFIKRIFDLLLLYVASPFFVASVPLDGGEKFGAWRNMFMAKLVSGFGSIISMEIYLIFAPLMISGNITLMSNEGGIKKGLDYVLKVLFLLGGMYSVYQSQNLIVQLINYQAGQQDSQTVSTGFNQMGNLVGLARNVFSGNGNGGNGSTSNSAGGGDNPPDSSQPHFEQSPLGKPDGNIFASPSNDRSPIQKQDGTIKTDGGFHPISNPIKTIGQTEKNPAELSSNQPTDKPANPCTLR